MYDHDLDTKGVFAFLRKQCPQGRHPAYPGPLQAVKVFASSVLSGYPESVLSPDERKDFCTMNQAFSYIGVELLQGRRLVPSCYTIRNVLGETRPGDSKSESATTLLNWQFEASSDMVSWVILDKRVFYPENQIMRGPPSSKVQQLAKKGCVSTWGIDPYVFSPEEQEAGFKYFRIVQIGTNYEGSCNLSLSALEVYGLTNDAQNWERK